MLVGAVGVDKLVGVGLSVGVGGGGLIEGGDLSVCAGFGADHVGSELAVRSTIKLLISWVLFYTGNGLLVLGCNLSWNF